MPSWPHALPWPDLCETASRPPPWAGVTPHCGAPPDLASTTPASVSPVGQRSRDHMTRGWHWRLFYVSQNKKEVNICVLRSLLCIYNILLSVTGIWVILTALNYYGLLKPFFTLYWCVCVRNVILHHFRYKVIRFNLFICILEQFKHAESK